MGGPQPAQAPSTAATIVERLALARTVRLPSAAELVATTNSSHCPSRAITQRLLAGAGA